MFWLASLSVLGVVALGPQVVLASFKFNFSTVEQCGPVQINFTGHGSNNHFVPTQLTILPFVDSDNTTLPVPIQISIPNGATNSTGIDLSFIPIRANTRFVATLDDGQGSAKVSDVTIVRVGNNSSCLSSNSTPTGTPAVDFYQLPQAVNQCENFTVNYNPTSPPPTITAFTPQKDSFEVTHLDAKDGKALFVMNGQRATQVVLLLNNTENQAASSGLMTIGGDSSSSKMCIMKNDSESNSNPGPGDNKPMKPFQHKSFALPKPAIIGIAVGAAVIVFAALLLLWYILRRRRRQRLAPSIRFNPALLDRRWPPDENEKKTDLFEQETPARWRLEAERVDLFGQRPPSNMISPSFPAGDYVFDPPYTNDKYRASVMTGDRSVRTSISSWNQFIPKDQRGEQIQRSSSSSSRLSLNTVDIQPILQMARVHGDSDSRPTAYQSRTPQPSTAGTAFNVSKPAAAFLVSTRRAQRTSDPPNIPDVVSAVSRNNSASVAALTAVPVPYMSTSYISFGEDSEEASGNFQAISGGNGIGD